MRHFKRNVQQFYNSVILFFFAENQRNSMFIQKTDMGADDRDIRSRIIDFYVIFVFAVYTVMIMFYKTKLCFRILRKYRGSASGCLRRRFSCYDTSRSEEDARNI